jgi:hypothetical protein
LSSLLFSMSFCICIFFGCCLNQEDYLWVIFLLLVVVRLFCGVLDENHSICDKCCKMLLRLVPRGVHSPEKKRRKTSTALAQEEASAIMTRQNQDAELGRWN